MDTTLLPLCERLAFVDQGDKLDVSLKLNRKKYKPRENVELDIQLTDDFGQPVSAELSLSVTDGSQIIIPDHQVDIRNYLLLSSDLKGSFDPVNQLFDGPSSKIERTLDLVMLTNGWRRFIWDQMLDPNSPRIIPRFHQGFDICGILKNEDLKAHGSSQLSLLVLGQGGFYTTRAEDGRFCFQGVVFKDSDTLSIQTVSARGPSVNLAVDFDHPDSPKVQFLDQRKIFPGAVVRRHIELNDFRVQDELLPGEQFELLREVVVQEDTLAAEESRSYRSADIGIDLANSPVPYSDLIAAMRGKVPGLQITAGGIRISGSTGDPLVIVDGVPVNNPSSVTTTTTTGGSGGNPGSAGASGEPQSGGQGQVTISAESSSNIYSFLQGMNPNNVDRIEVLRRSSASLYGSRGGNGVLLIYTKKGGEATTVIPIKSQVYQGFHQSRQFYTPRYTSLKEIGAHVDRRSTLHWEPFVKTGENGRATVRFYNSDEATSFNLVLQGVSKAGQLAAKTIRIDFAE